MRRLRTSIAEECKAEDQALGKTYVQQGQAGGPGGKSTGQRSQTRLRGAVCFQNAGWGSGMHWKDSVQRDGLLVVDLLPADME